jgi:hypothetical protein
MARGIKCPKCQAVIDVLSVIPAGEVAIELLATGEVFAAECYACNTLFFIRPLVDWNVGLKCADVVRPVLESGQETHGENAAAVTVNFDKRSQEVLDEMVGRMSEVVNLIGLAQKTLNLNLEAFRKTFTDSEKQQPKCIDCAHVVDKLHPRLYCMAPQLHECIEEIERNWPCCFLDCDAIRALTCTCGTDARWFHKRFECNYSYVSENWAIAGSEG